MKPSQKTLKELKKNSTFLLMVLPGALWFIILKYIPMFGNVIAFKDFRISRRGFIHSVISSRWVGLENFKFLFKTQDAYIITRNTILYNLVFIILGLIIPVTFAIALHEINNQFLRKIYQTGMMFPHFLSWIVVSYFVFGFLSVDKGLFNQLLSFLGRDPINWYFSPKHWPPILIFMNTWKGTGYGSVVYLASIVGIDKTYYEAAMIDGATKWQQIKSITLPLLTPLMTILTVLAVGRIIYADFGLFYQVPKNSGALYSVTNVIDTYVFRGLMVMGDIGMSTAAGLYQSFVGFILVVSSNLLVKKINPDHALF
ncbi:MAG: sugar ABC transporter permease [Epulopiscium sp.]|nr:sugar ABC transporter permease [Candidatus Epulonipiscium sp.]